MLLNSIVVYRGNPEAPLAQQERKLKAAAAKRKEVSHPVPLAKVEFYVLERFIMLPEGFSNYSFVP